MYVGDAQLTPMKKSKTDAVTSLDQERRIKEAAFEGWEFAQEAVVFARNAVGSARNAPVFDEAKLEKAEAKLEKAEAKLKEAKEEFEKANTKFKQTLPNEAIPGAPHIPSHLSFLVQARPIRSR
jgi:multidrug resistance efflux pump